MRTPFNIQLRSYFKANDHSVRVGERLAEVFLKVLDSYRIPPSQILSVTTDNASNNEKMMRVMVKKLREKGVRFSVTEQWIPCFAHTLNLGVQAALQKLKIAPTERDDVDQDTYLEEEPIKKLRVLIVKVSIEVYDVHDLNGVQNSTAFKPISP